MPCFYYNKKLNIYSLKIPTNKNYFPGYSPELQTLSCSHSSSDISPSEYSEINNKFLRLLYKLSSFSAFLIMLLTISFPDCSVFIFVVSKNRE